MPAAPRPDGDLNPYASPQVPNPLVDLAHLGVGVWRDGQLIVMHKDAVLPPFCVKTGEPTRKTVYVDAMWLCKSFQIYIVGPKLTVPLADRMTLISAWNRQFIVPLVFAVFVVCFILATWIGNYLGQRFEVPAGLLAGIISIGLVVWACVAGDLLTLVRTEGSYHWLSGAKEPFLNRLPPWQPPE